MSTDTKWSDLTANFIASANEAAQEMLAMLASISEEAGLKVSHLKDEGGITITHRQGGLVVAYVPGLTEEAWRAIQQADEGGAASFLIYNARHFDQILSCRNLQACICSVGLIGEIQDSQETIVNTFRDSLFSLKAAIGNIQPVN